MISFLRDHYEQRNMIQKHDICCILISNSTRIKWKKNVIVLKYVVKNLFAIIARVLKRFIMHIMQM